MFRCSKETLELLNQEGGEGEWGLVVVYLYLYWCCICISLHQGDFGIVKPRGIGRVGAVGVFRAPTFCSQAFYTNGQNQCPNKLDGFKVHKN